MTEGRKRKGGRKKQRQQTKKQENTIKMLDESSRKFVGAISPTNIKEQKERFLKYGLSPEFQKKKEKKAKQSRSAIRKDYFYHAKAILDKVKEQYSDGMAFIRTMYGPRITVEKATEYIEQYIREHDLVGEMTIYWSQNLSGSAKMCWKGPSPKVGKPESRCFSLVVKNAEDNVYISESGIKCLMNHEIGTHYFRAYNDGLQPWYPDRKKFGLSGYNSRTTVASEEGLACINTAINGNSKYLWGSALAYYTSCMATELTFDELFEHLQQYVSSKDYRWKLCVRVKRSLENTDENGGIGHDQVYFEGAADILSNLDTIDLPAMFTGRVSFDQTDRAKRIARSDCLRLPNFVKDLDRYSYMLGYIAYINGLADRPPVISPEKRIFLVEGKFDYDSYREKRDGKLRKRNQFEDSPYMCFIAGDSPVPKLPRMRKSARSKRICLDMDKLTQENRRDFIYPASPVPKAQFSRLRDMLYPDMNFDLDTSRSMTNICENNILSERKAAQKKLQASMLTGEARAIALR